MVLEGGRRMLRFHLKVIEHTFSYVSRCINHPMNWTPLNITVRVGCHLTYQTTVQTPVLFVLKPRLEGRVLVTQEKLSDRKAHV